MRDQLGAGSSLPNADLRPNANRSARVAVSRRRMLVLSAAALAGTQLGGPTAAAADDIEAHGISAFGDLKYPADFRHFEYVNPNAPKGGLFSQIGPGRHLNQNLLTFNSLNSYILKGDAALGIERTFATLMERAHDEPDAMYGQAARAVRMSKDGLSYRFLLRPETRFHDGTRLTAADVAFSLTTLKEKGHPIIRQILREFVGAEALDDATVLVRFSPGRARDVPLLVASLPIFSHEYYGKRPFDESTLDIPLGSGAYKVGNFEPGRFIEYNRVKDWWGADLPISRGRNNFDTLRYEYYRDREIAFEGFSAKSYLFREEFTSRVWATRYDFPAVRDGRVKRDVLPDDTPSAAQGWFINMRREQFKSPKLREALIYAFDYEWTNNNIMYGAYRRTQSPFQNSDMMAKGPPSPEELEVLAPFRDKLPPEIFGEPFVPPVSDGSGNDRVQLRKASQLLQEAGYAVKDGKRINANGQPITIEFLIDDPVSKPHHMPFIKNLATLGIEADLRVVDPVQYRARVDAFDFDIIVQRYSFSTVPGDSLRTYFSSQAASIKGSQNFAGIADPAIDALIERVIAAENRHALVVAARALDRVVRQVRHWIPHWYKPAHWVAYWDVYSRPGTKPRYARGVEDTWWYDRDKATKLERAG
jgi:microcin C transport system substrate-binding protein